MKLNVIVAFESGKQGIGIKNTIPWHLPDDLRNFSKVTKGQGNNAIIMGRKTWESLPKKPLPGRQNIILSRSLDDITLYGNELYFSDMKKAVDHCIKKSFDETWIIGGYQVYKEAINDIDVHELHITEIYKEYECDVFFPEIPEKFTCIKEEIHEMNDVLVRYVIMSCESLE